MKVEFTDEEAQFLFENLSALSVPLSNPNALQIVALGRSVLMKIKEAAEKEKADSQPK